MVRSENSAALPLPASLAERPLRVLHIGNVANNAYKNVKLLNECGLDCDVLCYDYFHIMGSPEWEDAEIDGTIVDQTYPNWSTVNLHGFARPLWFAQGRFVWCIRYLLARRRGQPRLAKLWWLLLRLDQWRMSNPKSRWVGEMIAPAARHLRDLAGSAARIPARCGRAVRRWLRGRSGASRQASGAAVIGNEPPVTQADDFASRTQQLVAEFRRLFPYRRDQLTTADLARFQRVYRPLRALLEHYDVIQAYAIDPILPLLCSRKPIVAFEHGTLRDLPYAETAEGRMTALGYAMADGVFITNGDCQPAIQRLALRRAIPMIHPLDERQYGSRGDPEEKSGLHNRFGCAHLFLCILRHDWAVKGTDLYLRALPALASRLGRSFRLLLTRWGSQVDDSRSLIAELKVEDLVVWLEPQPRRSLIRLLKQTDVLCDQTALPHFGATAPDGIAAGIPVLMSYRPESTQWIVAEPAPILPVFTVDDVVEQSLKALDPNWRRQYQLTARQWIQRYHSAQRVVDAHLAMYQECLTATATTAGLAPSYRRAG